MRRVLKIVLRVLGRLLALIILLALAGMVAIQSPRVQTALGQWAVDRYQDSFPAQISFSQITFRPFDAIVLEDVLLKDPSPYLEGMDTVAYVGNLTTKFSLWGLITRDGATVKRVKLTGGQFNLIYEPDSTAADGSIMNLYRVLGLPDPEDDGKAPSWGKLLEAKYVEVNDFTFRMANPVSAARMAARGRNYGEGAIDWNNFSIHVEEVFATHVKVADSHVCGTVERVKALETGTGFPLDAASAGNVDVGERRVLIEDLHIASGESDVLLRELVLSGPMDDYGDFVEKIRIDGDIREGSYLSLPTVRHFTDGLEGITFGGYVKGQMHGTVEDFRLEGIRILDPRNGVSLLADGSMKGLPETESTTLNVQVKDLEFGLDGLGGFVQAWSPGTRLDLSSLAKSERLHFSGNVSGELNRMRIDGDIDSDMGQARADVSLKGAVSGAQPIVIGGQLETRNLHLGRLLGIGSLGPLSMKTGLEGTFPRGGDMQVRIDSLNISRLNAFGYDYSRLSAVGNYSESAFDGRIIAADPNLNFLFQGIFNLSPRTRNAVYRFYASLGYADLHALHLDSRERSKLSFQASSNFIRTEKRDLLGDVVINDISLESETGRHEVGNIDIRAHANENVSRVRLSSSFLDASFVGDSSPANFLNDIRYLLLERELPALSTSHPEPWKGSSYEVNFTVKEARELFSFLMKGLYVEKKTAGSLKVDKDGIVTASIKSGRLAFRDKFIKDFSLDFNNRDQAHSAEITSSQISLSGAQILENRLSLYANDNQIGIGYSFDNGEQELTRAEVYLTGDLSREENGILQVSARALPSNIYYKGKGWGLSSGDIIYRGGDLSIEQLQARHDDEALLVHGGIRAEGSDTLSVQMEKFDIALLNTVSGSIPSLEGHATGHALVISPTRPSMGLLASITCDSTYIAGHRMGKLLVSSVWNDERQRFDAQIHNQLDGKRNLDAGGYFDPVGGQLHASARLSKFNMGYAAPLLNSLFSSFGGELSGEVGIDGTLSDFQLSSQGLRIENGLMELDYTRVPYRMEGPVELSNEGLKFKQVSLSDGEEGKGTASGSILLGGFRDYAMDLHLQFSQMRVLALPKGVNSTLFGNAYASGRADITGPINRLLLSVDATTVRSGEIHIPLGSGSSGRRTDILTFKEAVNMLDEDPYEQMMAAASQTSSRSSDFQVQLGIHATPQLQVFIDIDNESSLQAEGDGNIELDVSTAQSSFGLNGVYNITQGSFLFSAMNLVSRKFTIQDGSTIRFNGDVWNTDLDIKGLYVTKASLDNLVADQTGTARRTVNCGINITGRLRNPVVNFSIDIPDLSPAAQAQVEGALNTVDKVQKQFVYLLIAGNFLPSEESGITTNGSDVLFSNVSSIMSGQINNIFEKLNIPLDLGLNYQSTQMGSNLFDVALSTQLFNNRVIVNGTVGNRRNIDGTTTNEVAGDMDIEVKLNHSGSLRVKAFTHSADQFSSYLDNSQRHGAGISYQLEFNTFAQLLRELFSSRKEREERAQTEALSVLRTVSLNIDENGKSSK